MHGLSTGTDNDVMKLKSVTLDPYPHVGQIYSSTILASIGKKILK